MQFSYTVRKSAKGLPMSLVEIPWNMWENDHFTISISCGISNSFGMCEPVPEMTLWRQIIPVCYTVVYDLGISSLSMLLYSIFCHFCMLSGVEGLNWFGTHIACITFITTYFGIVCNALVKVAELRESEARRVMQNIPLLIVAANCPLVTGARTSTLSNHGRPTWRKSHWIGVLAILPSLPDCKVCIYSLHGRQMLRVIFLKFPFFFSKRRQLSFGVLF